MPKHEPLTREKIAALHDELLRQRKLHPPRTQYDPTVELAQLNNLNDGTQADWLNELLKIVTNIESSDELVRMAWILMFSLAKTVELEKAIYFIQDLSVQMTATTQKLVQQTYGHDSPEAIRRDSFPRGFLAFAGELLGLIGERMEENGCYDLPPFPSQKHLARIDEMVEEELLFPSES